MATSRSKPKSFTFTLPEETHRRLMELAEAENRSAANWLVTVIDTTYEARAPKRRATTPRTKK